MKSKLLILSTYPAPYRMLLFQKLRETFDADVFFETSQGDERNSAWFYNQDACLLDSKEGKEIYKKACQQLKKYDLVVCYEYSTKESFKLICLCKLFKIPYAINCDGVILNSKENLIKKWIKTFLIKSAKAHLASGEHAKEYFLKYGAKKETVHIHTFSSIYEEDILKTVLTSEAKCEIRKQLDLPVNCKLAIAVGRFIPLKRYDALIKSWKVMNEDTVLLLVGGGPEYDVYTNIIEREGLKNVLLEKFHPKEELLKYYKAADVFVHPTSYDVWGLVVNEAMACGLPVVVSDTCVAGLELVEQGQNGYLVSHDASDEIIEKTKLVLKDENKRSEMACKALRTIESYTIENMAKIHIGVCKDVISDSVLVKNHQNSI